MPRNPTPLARALSDDGGQSRATPLEAFRLARRWWFQGRRLNLSALAEELGVSRATLTRWVGNKDLLLAEILWQNYARMLELTRERARARYPAGGIDYLQAVYNDVNTGIMESEPMHRFLSQDPQLAVRVLHSSRCALPERVIQAWQSMLEEESAAGNIVPQMDTRDLAYLIVRIGQGYLFGDITAGRKARLEPANTAMRLLLTPGAQMPGNRSAQAGS